MKFSLNKHKILITGASSGIGRGIALGCSAAGASLLIAGRNKERLADTYSCLSGNGHIQLTGDLTIAEDVDCLVGQLPELDGVVLCAGLIHTAPAKFNDAASVERLFQTNTFSNILLIHKLLKKKKLKAGCSIVIISSLASMKPYIGNSLYSATKGALDSFAKVLALECGIKKIRVNCIHPGIIRTKENSVFSEEEMAVQETKIPLGFGKTEYIADGCIFLLSEAGKWITGSDLVIDGGQSLG